MNKEPLRVVYDCIPCAIGSLINLFKKGLITEEKQDKAMRALLSYLSEVDYKQVPPALGREMHRIIRKVLDNADPYSSIKKEFNQLMLDYYPELKKKIANSSDPFQLALRMAIAGNIIDFGPNHNIDINKTIEQATSVKLGIDHSDKLKDAISRAEIILYLGDNAGEIVMDRLFLETIDHPNIYFAVRGGPIINDVNLDDAIMVGIDKIAKVLPNGDDSPGTIIERVSPQFREIFDNADLIISKGQGNYEGLSGVMKNIYFVLMAKCEHVANHLGVKKGDFVVTRN
jgi:uncharacterized protein with ATP-grasp and redox domains